MTSMKILISGAGIGGNALAFWLSKLGHDVTIIERFPSLRATGLQVDLRGHGIEVMRRMGLEQAFRAKMAPEQGMQVVDKTGRRRAFFPVHKAGEGLQNFTSEFEIMRGDLCQLIYDATKNQAQYLFGMSIDGFEDKDNAVHVNFTNGKTAKFDLLVGADGQRSSTRRKMFEAGVAEASYHPLKDEYMAYFAIPKPMKAGEEYIATTYMAPGKKGIMTRRHSQDELQVYLGCTTKSAKFKESHQTGDVQALKAAWADMFKGAGWQSDEIVKALMHPNTDFYSERPALVKLDSWSKGRVTLLGDAAYCPTATTGMGTTAAIVGAYILAGEISRHCGPASDAARSDDKPGDNLVAALEAYQRKFQPFMDQVQEGVSTSGDSAVMGWFTSSAFGISVMNNLAGLASLLRLNLGRWFLKENIKGWDLPNYAALSQNSEHGR